MAKVFTFLSVRCMVNDNNRMNIFLVPRFVINNHTERFVGVVCYIKHIAVLGTTISEFSVKSYLHQFRMYGAEI